MAFVSSFATYVLVLIVLCVIAVGGVFAGKALRAKKDAKTALEKEIQE